MAAEETATWPQLRLEGLEGAAAAAAAAGTRYQVTVPAALEVGGPGPAASPRWAEGRMARR